MLYDQLPQIYCLKTTHIYYFTILWITSLGAAGQVLCSGSHKAEIKVFAELGSYLEALG